MMCQAGAHTVRLLLKVKSLEDDLLWKMILYEIFLW